jgi:polysaccharide deacetylase family protein (PEP-CTERM system associated)
VSLPPVHTSVPANGARHVLKRGGATAPQHVLTVTLEDYYHVKAFNRLIHSGQWYRFENRLERNTDRTLELLDETRSKATFFVFGHLAESMPELVRKIVDRGHEVGSRGMYPRDIAQLTPDELLADLVRSKEAVETASGHAVRGFRAGEIWNNPDELWILDLIAEAGYQFDSSFCPWMRRAKDRPDLLLTHRRTVGDRDLWVFPISSFSTLGWRLPLGGNFLRQFPRPLVRHELRRWASSLAVPLVTYFNVWEIDPDQPRIEAAPLLQRIRQYRNLDQMYGLLQETLSSYRFTSVADWLRVAPQTSVETIAERTPAAARVATPVHLARGEETPRVAATLVVPCFNEANGLAYLRNTLGSVEKRLGDRFDLRFVFVDDCSSDSTFAGLQEAFGGKANCKVVRHEVNGGVAAAIMTGIRAADTEIVCSIDADCSYDPHELAGMIPLLTDDVDLVTASPYHPDGGVLNVAKWRLFLSRSLSGIYRHVLHNNLYTYTSCFRVYRRSAAIRIPINERGFLGVAEFIGRLDLSGSRIVEYPTTLEVRILGRSKMKVLKTIAGQLGLLRKLIAIRMASPAVRVVPPRRTIPSPVPTPRVHS